MAKIPELSMHQKYSDLRFWRLCNEVTLQQAILLALGLDPAKNESVEIIDPYSQPVGYPAMRTALLEAVNSEHLPHENFAGRGIETTVTLKDFEKFLLDRGFESEFFDGSFNDRKSHVPFYMQKDQPFYAPKLAAAVEAWLSVTEAKEHEQGGTPKQAIEIWLRKNADRLGLTSKDGNPNNQGIEEIAKIVNWQPGGGASKTPRK